MLTESRVSLKGNLGRDPEIIKLNGGKEMMKLSIATNRVYMKEGAEVKKVTWHNIEVFNKKYISVLGKNLKKGDLISVEGAEFSYNEYETKDGNQVKEAQITVSEFNGDVYLLKNLNKKETYAIEDAATSLSQNAQVSSQF